MTNILILGADTDAGKTTIALLWLAEFHHEYHYWKPLESGGSDTGVIQDLVPETRCFPPWRQFNEAVAPSLAARRQGETIPTAANLAKQLPKAATHLLVETFGGPFSPLNETELQIELIRRWEIPMLLVSSSALGAITRTLQCLYALDREQLFPFAVVLLGDRDDFAAGEIQRHGGRPVIQLQPPHDWTILGIKRAAESQVDVLRQIRALAATPQSFDSSHHETTADLLSKDRKLVWHPYTSLQDATEPLVATAAQNEFLHLADGRKVIDGISSWWTILHGHRDPRLMSALRSTQQHMDHVLFAGVTHRHGVHLAELLLSTIPWEGGRVFYSDNGSTAVEVALKMAYQFWCHHGEPERTLFIGFESGYHGDTFGAMAASRDPVFFGRFEPLLFHAEIVPVSAQQLDDMLAAHKGKVAAAIIEPIVQGAGGMRMHREEELENIAKVAAHHDVLLIVDEVMTGGGRLGPLWAHQSANVRPDLICAAKTLTGGVLPLAATMAAPKIVAAFSDADRSRTFFHGHSFSAHPLACAVGVANWQMLLAGEHQSATGIETFWRRELGSLQDHPLVREVRIRGSIVAVEIDSADDYLSNVSAKMRASCLENGVFLRPLGNVLYALPPLETSESSLEQIANSIKSAVSCLA